MTDPLRAALLNINRWDVHNGDCSLNERPEGEFVFFSDLEAALASTAETSPPVPHSSDVTPRTDASIVFPASTREPSDEQIDKCLADIHQLAIFQGHHEYGLPLWMVEPGGSRDQMRAVVRKLLGQALKKNS